MSGEPPVELAPPTVSPPETAADDPRLGRWLAADGPAADEARVALVGFPSDEGVRRNDGRPGAAEGPAAIRRELYGLTPDPREAVRNAMEALLDRTLDLGNVRVTGRVEEDQQRLGRALAPLLERGAVPVVLGGGHETALGHFLGYVRAGLDVEVLNWDAHPDVRPAGDAGAHSGSPFRQMLLHPSGRCRGYAVAGLQPRSVARAHLEFLEEHGADVVWADDLDRPSARRLLERRSGPTLSSFDLDAVDRAHAPGVSAPATDGLGADLWLAAAEMAGGTRSVASVEVVELSPPHDPGGGTASLAAATVWRFLRGMTGREPEGGRPALA